MKTKIKVFKGNNTPSKNPSKLKCNHKNPFKTKDLLYTLQKWINKQESKWSVKINKISKHNHTTIFPKIKHLLFQIPCKILTFKARKSSQNSVFKTHVQPLTFMNESKESYKTVKGSLRDWDKKLKRKYELSFYIKSIYIYLWDLLLFNFF